MLEIKIDDSIQSKFNCSPSFSSIYVTFRLIRIAKFTTIIGFIKLTKISFKSPLSYGP